MKIAIPMDENQKDVCVAFGRAPYFMIWDTDAEAGELLENPAAQAQGGAGLKAAQFVVDSGAQVLITVRCGENAAEVMQAADIRIYKSQETGAAENIQAFQQEKLAPLTHFHAGFHGGV